MVFGLKVLRTAHQATPEAHNWTARGGDMIKKEKVKKSSKNFFFLENLFDDIFQKSKMFKKLTFFQKIPM